MGDAARWQPLYGVSTVGRRARLAAACWKRLGATTLAGELHASPVVVRQPCHFLVAARSVPPRFGAFGGRMLVRGGHPMQVQDVSHDRDMSRRTLLKGGGAALAGLSALQVAGPAHAFPGGPGEEVIPWLDQPPPSPVPGRPQPAGVGGARLLAARRSEKFFIVSHYGNRRPSMRRPGAWASPAWSRGRSRCRWPTSRRARAAR